MKTIKNEREFLEWIVGANSDFDDDSFKRNEYVLESASMYIEDFFLDEEDLNYKSFSSTSFDKCTFKSCNFNTAIFQSCNFYDCVFVSCDFYSTKFFESTLSNCVFDWCTIVSLELVDIDINGTTFNNCTEILDLKIRGQDDRILTFNSCDLHFLDIEPSKQDSLDIYNFNDCILMESSFDRLDFTRSIFKDCSLSLIQFSSCELSQNSIDESNVTPGNEFNMIDIRTILNSPPLKKNVLEKIFGINSSDIKEYLIDLTSKIEFQSIFISYSFVNKNFAKTINEILQRRGIMTFLWESDSPGGNTLQEIMSSNINKKDRILFIASEDSLKSKACQFELTQGRKKQEKTWNDILFPIHIDNFLFETEKNKIRPIEKQNEYWKNFKELKRINSLDFSEFVNPEGRNEHEFEKLIYRLIKGLRK